VRAPPDVAGGLLGNRYLGGFLAFVLPLAFLFRMDSLPSSAVLVEETDESADSIELSAGLTSAMAAILSVLSRVIPRLSSSSEALDSGCTNSCWAGLPSVRTEVSSE